MRNSKDPQVHKQREELFIQHVQSLLNDNRLRVDTTEGRRPVSLLERQVIYSDKASDLKRSISEMGKPDVDLELRMPVGKAIEVILSRKKMLVLKAPVGRLRVLCVSPSAALLKQDADAPAMGLKELQKLVGESSPPVRGMPTTLAILSTSGFTIEAHEMAERRADRTLILVEPNDAGGWSLSGPVETKALVDLFDPESDVSKRQRIRDAIEEGKTEILNGGLAMDRIAARTLLPVQLIENEMKAYAGANSGLTAKRVDGRVVLIR